MRLSRYDLIDDLITGIIYAASTFGISTKLRLKLFFLLLIILLAVIIEGLNRFSLYTAYLSLTWYLTSSDLFTILRSLSRHRILPLWSSPSPNCIEWRCCLRVAIANCRLCILCLVRGKPSMGRSHNLSWDCHFWFIWLSKRRLKFWALERRTGMRFWLNFGCLNWLD